MVLRGRWPASCWPTSTTSTRSCPRCWRGERLLAAARDRDLADLGAKVDANQAAINALGEQTAAGFTEMRGKLDAAAAGQQRIVDLLTGLISDQSDQQ